jgi:hypothetical protein
LSKFVIEFIQLSASQFSTLFNVAIQLFDSVIIPRVFEYNLIGQSLFYALISAPISSFEIGDLIFTILIKLLRCGFDFPNKTSLFFSLIPYLEFSTEGELFELSDLLDPRIRMIRTDFDQIVLNLYNKNQCEDNYLILNFFMRIVNVFCDRYYEIVFRISEVIVLNLERWQPLSMIVFDRLVDVINKRDFCVDRELRFLAAVQNRRAGEKVQMGKLVQFPRIGIEPDFGNVMFRPLNRKLTETVTGWQIEKTVALKKWSKLQRMKEVFAVMAEPVLVMAPEMEEREGKGRIEECLRQRKEIGKRKSRSRKELFLCQEVDGKMFRPDIGELNGFVIDSFPPLIR